MNTLTNALRLGLDDTCLLALDLLFVALVLFVRILQLITRIASNLQLSLAADHAIRDGPIALLVDCSTFFVGYM